MLALKTLAYTMTGLTKMGVLDACERFIDNQGLKYLFPALMKKVTVLCAEESQY